MKDSARYAKIVEWSDEDQCYVGSSPGLIYGGCHGTDEEALLPNFVKLSRKPSPFTTRMANHSLPPLQVVTLRTRCKTSDNEAVAAVAAETQKRHEGWVNR